MTIHIFNPEHDIALASNLEHFTAPHAGRELRHDLGFLPALWASGDDYVLVDDIDATKEGLRRTAMPARAKIIDAAGIEKLVKGVDGNINILPWGWDLALRQRLKDFGIDTAQLPSNAQLNIMRQISHRAWAAEHLLRPLKETHDTVGEAEALHDIDEVRMFLTQHHDIVLKAPWSSSGRGIKYVSDYSHIDTDTYFGITPQLQGWIRNVILRQGCVMAEPYYHKVLDFGMEFTSDGKGLVKYEGLSVFHTANGAYTGNIIDDDEYKKAVISRYLPLPSLSEIELKIVGILSEAFNGAYTGPFGIDMMVVRTENELRLNPCVELNLRMTMGHVALLFNKKCNIEQQTMRIVYTNGRYNLNFQNLNIRNRPIPIAGETRVASHP